MADIVFLNAPRDEDYVKHLKDHPTAAGPQVPITSKRVDDHVYNFGSMPNVRQTGPAAVHVLTLRGDSIDGENVEAFRVHSFPTIRSRQMSFSSSNSPGMVTAAQEKKAIDKAQVVMVAVSANYVVSNEFKQLVAYATKQGKRIIPLISRPTNLAGTGIEELQGFPRDGKALSEMSPAERDRAFAGDGNHKGIVSEVKAAVGVPVTSSPQVPITSMRVSGQASDSGSMPNVCQTGPAAVYVLTLRGDSIDGVNVEAFRVHSFPAIRSGQMSFSSSNSEGMDSVKKEQEAIDKAQVVMVAVSANYVASDEFKQLVGYATKQGKRMIPLISRPTNLAGTGIEELQGFPRDGKALFEMSPAERDRAFAGEGSDKGIVSEVKAAAGLPVTPSTQVPMTSIRVSEQASNCGSMANVRQTGPAAVHVLTLRGDSIDGANVEAFRKYSSPAIRSKQMSFSSSNSEGMDSIEKEQEAIDNAQVVMVAVSANYVASDEFEQLVGYARGQGKRIIPLISRPTNLAGTGIEELQGFPRDGKALSEMSRDERDSVFRGDESHKGIVSEVKAAAGLPVPSSAQVPITSKRVSDEVLSEVKAAAGIRESPGRGLRR
jgi:hypothetical protein